MKIPGSNTSTKGWSLNDYKDLVRKYQGNEVQIVETPYESESIGLLAKALDNIS